MAAESMDRRQNGGRRNGNSDVPRPFLIGVAGGTASGKSTVCKRIMEHLGQHEVEQKQRQVITVSMDSFYRELTEEEQIKARKGQYNFDHPNAFDEDLILEVLGKIKAAETVQIPRYDMVEHKRKPNDIQTIYPADVVLVEGILTFYFKDIREHFHMKLFVDTDADTRLSRRVQRDASLGRDIDQILYQYTTYVKPAFEDFCLPSKKYADVIIPRGADNHVAIDLIVQHIQDLLRPNKASIPKRTRTTSDSLLRFKSMEEGRYKSAH